MLLGSVLGYFRLFEMLWGLLCCGLNGVKSLETSFVMCVIYVKYTSEIVELTKNKELIYN